ncbi:hypothetical protein I3842_08G084200 [Carya illinoinensis]|uniref:Uncharacterized protein n=1 Tax=Carya illinoinensis TaxID=32201 RepID=A0A922EB73_CARIL|nr:hypothetical protein I3842_08G084200 [Carya illinoinensis]
MEMENGLNGGTTTTHDGSELKNNVEKAENNSPNVIGDREDFKKSTGGDPNSKTVPFLKLFSFADSTDVFLMIAGTMGAIGNGLGLPLITVFFGEMINSLGRTTDIVPLVSKVCLKIVYLGIGVGAGGFIQVACWMITGERQTARIRGLYLKAILRQDVAFFDNETNTGEVVGRMYGDTVLIQDAMGEKLMSTFIGGFVVAFSKGWLLTLVMLPHFLFLWQLTASSGQAAYTNAANVVEETISSIRTICHVVSFTREKQAVMNYERFLKTNYKAGVHEGLVSGLGFAAFKLVVFGSFAIAVWFGSKLILNKGYNGGDVLNVITAVLTGFAVAKYGNTRLSMEITKSAAYKMFKTIERKPKIDTYSTKAKILDDIHGDIELRDVFFSYPARPNEQIFSGFSLYINRGTTSALVGQSGSGKSTVISLIERFYDPQAGEAEIGLVSQEPVLFAYSITDNIAYGKDGTTFEEIRVATELANAATFIDKLPQGLDTVVGGHGMQLSGGQKQRIAIARAILKDPRILLLDEATSALDAESERIVQEALDRIMVNRTTVIVAHRLSTVRNADMIAVIQQGKIVEKAYSQLIHLKEVNKESEQASDDQNRLEITAESSRHSSLRYSQRMSHLRSISQGSSVNSCSHRSFSAFGLPIEVLIPDDTWTEPEENFPKVSIRRLAYLNKPEIPILLLGAIAAILNGTLFPIFGMLLSKVIKSFYEPPHKLRKDTNFWSIIFVILGVVSFLAIPARAYLFSVAGCKLIQRVRLMCFEKLVHMEVGWFDKPEHSCGSIGARLSADAARVGALVGDSLGQILDVIASAVAGLVIAFVGSWQLAIIILALIPLIGINAYAQLKFMKGFIYYLGASQVANDAVGSIRTVASFCAEEKVMNLYRSKCEGPRKAGIKLGLITGIGFGTSFGFLFLAYATSFYAGTQLVQARKATSSDVFQVFFALTFAAMGVSQTSSMGPDTGKVKNAVSSIYAIIHQQSKIDASDESDITLDNFKGGIEFRHVSFKYPCRPNVQIFHDLSLTIHPNKTVASVGESGSGKSTVISLLQRFYDRDSGHIKLDGIEIQKFQVKWLRQQMGLVSQEPVLFNDTIRANIAYGKEEGNATEIEIIDVAELANAHSFISGLQKLSGGQKQRVAIARAMIKSPKILLLDEATSALVVESERVVQDALNKIWVNRTTVNADVIAVFKNGVIVEKGRHENLIKNNDGFYASLVSIHTSTNASTA